ncbi:MAG: bifunctional 4-hydroxy-2-oxoglutarate aldolase/2-dehydro-3-deoxy-phosphogluconate aldolase [Christensenellales bacterium]|uniref:2-dehydro-3-deoxy-phosphogluconate aldolase n=1 Tax=Candidatus Avichristensenella intestinipullorum TaxID=2840693 RepID=A0A9D0YXB5_9FIRM|nr:bifunctional 4-hydroxy-2-oxoglutarate aldolase/2-dehydro-3-deoxy-phosphogluconate aldolase [Christensenellales bacterium]HIQ63809.1 bifunctional 4-hydroxy-2-oxoglutarate aldolase/2-dehydro-3-deoxy-phosphogluconate aldolase [Candidatus Avichristensenella intestinipullorum]
MDILQAVSLRGIVPVIKLNRPEDAVPLCGALSRGGLPVAEITFRTAAAEESIRRVHAELPDVLLGAGTVLTCEQVDRAADAGAAFIVSPGLNPRVVQHCLDRGLPVLPGCACPSDMERALELGLKTVKFFPAETLGGVAAIKAMSAPYGGLTFVPTGGIDEKKLPAYLAFDKILACGGSWMVKEAWIQEQNFEAVERAAAAAVDAMLGFSLGVRDMAAILRGEKPQLRTHSVRRAAFYLAQAGVPEGSVTLLEA